MGWFSLPDPDEKVDDWHVAPGIDVVSYALSWVWVLIPLALLGPTRQDYIGWYVLILAATDVHRHYNFPMVYADSQVRAQYPLRFFLFPGICLVMFASSPWLAELPIYMTTAEVAAGLAWIFVLFQILRRDGSDEVPDGRALGTVLALAVGPAVLSWLRLDPGIGLGEASWWFAGALLSALYLDFDLRRRRMAAREKGQDGQATRKLFVVPLIVLGLLTLATLLGPRVDAGTEYGGFKLIYVLNSIAVFARDNDGMNAFQEFQLWYDEGRP